jgi:hypothetical protein
MEATTANAIIAAIGAVAGATLSAFIKSYLENRNFFSNSGDRRKALTGVWSGIVDQVSSNVTGYKIELNIIATKKQIIGSGKVYRSGQIISIKLSGAFRNDEFLKLDYENSEGRIIQFGSFILELSSGSDTLDGRFVGYGHVSKSIIHGSVSLSKEYAG